MSVLSVLIFIAQGASLRRGWSRKKIDEDVAFLELFSRILAGQEIYPDKLREALEQSIDLDWENVYDFVNPFGDRRGDAFNSVWTFDLDKDIIFLTKKDRLCSAPLGLARERPLTLDDFQLVNTPTQTSAEEQALPEPCWDPEINPSVRQRKFLGRILRDFAYTWRHVLRRRMNTTTFMKLAYATIWISRMEFTIRERMGFEHVSGDGPYVKVVDLPSWETPDASLVQAGASWFVLAQDTRDGLDIVRRHTKSHPSLRDATDNVIIYAILTLQQVTLCKAYESQLVWTRSETLFGDVPPSDTAIDMILWASDIARTEAQPSKINALPAEIQDRILYHAATSPVASAKLGCELGLGSPSTWVDGGGKIRIEESKRHRYESSPIESQILLNGVMSGLSYKREPKPRAIHAAQSPFPGRAAPPGRAALPGPVPPSALSQT